jgi:hypothetical protein
MILSAQPCSAFVGGVLINEQALVRIIDLGPSVLEPVVLHNKPRMQEDAPATWAGDSLE